MKFSVRSSHDLGHAIQQLRRYKNVSQADLAGSVNAKQNAISRLEGGKPGVVVDLLFRIFAKLDLEIEIRPRQKTTSKDIAEMFR